MNKLQQYLEASREVASQRGEWLSDQRIADKIEIHTGRKFSRQYIYGWRSGTKVPRQHSLVQLLRASGDEFLMNLAAAIYDTSMERMQEKYEGETHEQ